MADFNSETTTTPLVLVDVTSNSTDSTPVAAQVASIFNWLTFGIGLPAIGLAIYALKNLSTGQNKVPVHVVFLLVSDIISFFSRPRVDQDPDQDTDQDLDEGTENGTVFSSGATDFIFYFGVICNLTLMLVIAQERHVSVAYPRCLSGCGQVRRSPVVALVLWAAPLAVLALAVLQYQFWFAVSLLAPFPFLLFFAVDSWRALVCSRSNPTTPERRRMVWTIAAIWANYTFLYGPFVVSVLLQALERHEVVQYLELVSHLLLYLSPLVDPIIYIFMTSGAKEVLRLLPCCQRPQSDGLRSPTVDTVAESVETRF